MHPEFQINNICNKVADKQHGYKKHHQAGFLDLNKCLIGDICRLLRMSACYGMNDVIRCFDRIDHTPAIITLMRLGLAYNSTYTLFQFCTKIGYGIASPVYNDNFIPLAGCGKINGLGPTLWALISMVILSMCKKAVHRMKFLTSITKLPIYFMGYLFVDDANIF